MTKLTLLFIHGAGGTKNKWNDIESNFKDYTCKYITLPGQDGDGSEVPHSIEETAALIESEIDKDTIVIGHSMGGMIGLELAARNPNVKGLVLAASFYELPVHSSILESLEAGVFPNSLFYASYAKGSSEEFLASEKEKTNLVSTEVAKWNFKACNDYTAGKDRLANLDISVAAILGDVDRLIPPEAGKKLQAVNENIKLFEIKNSGHYPMLENTEDFSTALKEFCRDISL
ncbi:alpha/beta fold hydrolase [Sporosarcina sp. CAU 1771]